MYLFYSLNLISIYYKLSLFNILDESYVFYVVYKSHVSMSYHIFTTTSAMPTSNCFIIEQLNSSYNS